MSRKQNSKVNRKIVLAGGHAATTALSVIEELVRRASKKSDWEIYWIGTSRAMEGKNIPTIDSKIFPKKGVTFHPIVAGRLQRRFTLWTIPSLAKIPLGFLQALKILIKVRPDIILSFGGFAAFPAVVAGFLLRIPIIIHEQTAAVGRANKLSAPFASKIALARPQSVKFFGKEKCVVVGNPILSEIGEVLPKNRIGEPPTIFITAGSRGSQSINNIVEEIVEDLLQDFIVIHQTGFVDFEKFKDAKASLPMKLQKNYEIYDLIDPTQMDGMYRRSDIVIARAGANTVAEIIATKRPAVLIPLPWAYMDEQQINAKFAERYGIARVLDQKSLTPQKLLSEIHNLREEWKVMVSRAKSKKSPDKNASAKLVDLIGEFVK